MIINSLNYMRTTKTSIEETKKDKDDELKTIFNAL